MGEVGSFENEFPEIFKRLPDRVFTKEEFQEELYPIDSREIFDILGPLVDQNNDARQYHIRDIKDPEHPMTLEELGVVDMDFIKVDAANNYCCVEFKPTIPHCSMATLIGLCIKVQLIRLLPSHFKVDVKIVPGTHSSYQPINKQLADKERIAAALENNSLSEVLNDCLMFFEPQTLPDFILDEVEKFDLKDHPKVIYIQLSRQHIESYRRWKYVLGNFKN